MVSYNGSLNDVANIVEACRNARSSGLDGKFKIVMDGGFFDDKKLNAMHSEGLTLTVGVPAYLDCAKCYIDTYGEGFYSPEFYLNHSGTYGRVFIGLCTESSKMLNEDLDCKLECYEEEMSSIAKYSTVIKKYVGLYNFFENEYDKGFTYERSEKKIYAARKRFGYFVIFTTDMEITAQKIRC